MLHKNDKNVKKAILKVGKDKIIYDGTKYTFNKLLNHIKTDKNNKVTYMNEINLKSEQRDFEEMHKNLKVGLMILDKV